MIYSINNNNKKKTRSYGAEWSVTYDQQEICAVKGSTVSMTGRFQHPEGLKVTETFWIRDSFTILSWPDLRTASDYSGRVEYSVNEQNHVSFKLSNVIKRDEQEYCLRIITNEEKQRYLGRPGVTLRVTGKTRSIISIQKNTTQQFKLQYNSIQKLYNQYGRISPIHCSEDAGSYSCAQETLKSDLSLDPPKNVSVSNSSSGGIVEGSSVTLTCSSDANPPVENYTWFKGSSSVGTGGNYSIPNISSEDSGEYTCQSRNELGERRSLLMSCTLFNLVETKN
uniref:Ig-like domain-containing protein n=1 Tax=Astyanax mexicanus TaxID=7994 RepID=A0A3B1KKF9_ASTMX